MTSTGMALKFHSRILPIALILMGVYCLVKRNSITCTSREIDSSVLESYCLGPHLTAKSPVGRFGLEDDLEDPKVQFHYDFGLMLIVWAWVCYSCGDVWNYMEGRFLKSLQDSKTPQKIIQKNPGKCRVYLIKYLSVLALAIFQLILFMVVTSTSLIGKTEKRRLQEAEANEDLDNFRSSWSAIANGEHVLEPSLARCTYRRFGGSGNIQTHDALCHLDFNRHLEIIYLCCMILATISMIHLIMEFLHNIIVSYINPLQALHLCLYGSYTWTQARESLAREERFSGKWMLLQMFQPKEDSDNLEMDMVEKPLGDSYPQ